VDENFFDDFGKMLVRAVALPLPLAGQLQTASNDLDKQIDSILAPYHDVYWILGQSFAFRADGFNDLHAAYVSELENLFTDYPNSTSASVLRAAETRSEREWSKIVALTHECSRFLNAVASKDVTLGQQMADLALRWVAIMVAVSTASHRDKNTLLDEAFAIYATKTTPIENLPRARELSAEELKQFLDEAFTELVGLSKVKDEIEKQVDFFLVQRMRFLEGLSSTRNNSRHLVFLGNPGTGKTVVARIIGSLYHKLGFLETNRFIEASRQTLVSAYLGETAIQTAEIVKSAIGGVLFIDEAYTLSPPDAGGLADYGREAIDTILKLMEDHRENLVVIVAGYNSEMERFFNANPGLASRFNRRIEFHDYSPPDLLVIFNKLCVENNYKKSDSLDPFLLQIFDREKKVAGNQFGNARYIRNLFERVIEQHARRVAATRSISREELQNLLLPDFETQLVRCCQSRRI